ncbi:MAG: tetratricopeptide repeat protein [Armatimonadetes bacterium]|nr:tetratricopeptide repeat protein [Armatimonadota bacterium]
MRPVGSRIYAMLVVLVGVLSQPAWAPDAFSDGLALFNAGDWTRAASELVLAASRQPNDATVRLTAGVALANIKRYAEAAAQFRSAARIEPNGILPHLLLDGVYAEMGNHAESRRSRDEADRILRRGQAFGTPTSSDYVLTKSLQRYPQNAIAHLLLGDLYQLQGKLGTARRYYERASELAPKWTKPLINLGVADLKINPQTAEQRLRRAIEMDPSNLRAYLWLGDALLEQRKIDQAIDAYERAATDNRLATEARIRIGDAQLRAGNYQPAQQAFAQAAERAPYDPRPIAGEAQALQKEGKLKQAEEKYARAADVLSTNRATARSKALVAKQLGAVQIQQGRIEDAIANLKLSFDLHPTEESARALVEAQRKANKLNEGISENESALEKNPGNVTAMTYLLAAYKESGNYAGRIDMAKRLIKADPSNASAYYAELGAAHMAVGNVAEGVQAYIRAFETGDPITWERIARSAASSGALEQVKERVDASFRTSRKERTGMILFDIQSVRNDHQGMIAAADALTKLNPDQPTHWLRLGHAYERAGNKELALGAYIRAAAGSDPEAASAARARIEALK